jgi:CheY-like chemotaxis protein
MVEPPYAVIAASRHSRPRLPELRIFKLAPKKIPVSNDARTRSGCDSEDVKTAEHTETVEHKETAEHTLTLRCIIVDDSAPFLDAARTLLEREGIAVVGVASTSAEGLQRVRELRPDVTLVDIDLGAESGFDLARRLTDGQASSRVILISTHAERDFADLIDASSADGFLAKSDLSADALYEVLGLSRERG